MFAFDMYMSLCVMLLVFRPYTKAVNAAASV